MYKTIIAEDGQKYNLVPVDEPTQAPAPPKKKWEPKGRGWYVTGYGSVFNSYSLEASILFGTEYKTKELAEKARDYMRIHNLLLSRKMEECPDDGDYYIYKSDSYNKSWCYYSPAKNVVYPDVVYFTRQIAEKICEELNDPELNFLNI